MHHKMNRAMARDRKCTHSNGHAHAYKARPIHVHGPFIIFGQMSWYGMPARPITFRGASLARFEQHGHIIARRIR